MIDQAGTNCHLLRLEPLPLTGNHEEDDALDTVNHKRLALGTASTPKPAPSLGLSWTRRREVDMVETSISLLP